MLHVLHYILVGIVIHNEVRRIDSDAITRIVNRHDDHYADRHNNLIRFLNEGLFDDVY